MSAGTTLTLFVVIGYAHTHFRAAKRYVARLPPRDPQLLLTYTQAPGQQNLAGDFFVSVITTPATSGATFTREKHARAIEESSIILFALIVRVACVASFRKPSKVLL